MLSKAEDVHRTAVALVLARFDGSDIETAARVLLAREDDPDFATRVAVHLAGMWIHALARTSPELLSAVRGKLLALAAEDDAGGEAALGR